jgi:hypothetical protein
MPMQLAYPVMAFGLSLRDVRLLQVECIAGAIGVGRQKGRPEQLTSTKDSGPRTTHSNEREQNDRLRTAISFSSLQ